MKGKELNFIKIFFLFLIAISGCSGPDNEEGSRPNILWIVADDLGTDLGCYGNTVIATPNLDRLASESVRYTNFHTVTAVCSPSRSALITGMYPVSINCHQHRTYFKDSLPGGVVPITEYMKKAGYFVTNGSFSNLSHKGKTDYNFKFEFDSLYQGTNWRDAPENMPFFAQVQIFFPHRPFYRDSLNPVNPENVVIPPYYPDHPIVRKDWALYLETIQLMDREVGRILDSLEQDGLDDNTIVFFFGDQGRPHVRAKQFLYDPGTNTPMMVRFPDGTSAGTVSDKLVSNIDISSATLHLAKAEVPGYLHGINFLDESINRPYLFTMRDRRDETVDRIRAVRSKDYKYIRNFYPDRPYTQPNYYKRLRYPTLTLMRILTKRGELNEIQSRFLGDRRPSEELYDLEKDPFETHNLAGNPDYERQLTQMREALDNWLDKYDTAQYPEDPAEINYARESMYENYWVPEMKKKGLDPAITDEEYLEYWEEYLLDD